MTDSIVHIATLQDLQRLAGMPPSQHPGFFAGRIEEIGALSADYPSQMTYGFYNIGLKRNLNGYIRYGRSQYDFQEGILGFCAPGQVIGHDPDVMEGAEGWVLFFEPELLAGHPLEQRLPQYGFFDYQTNEGLHLSKAEEDSLDLIFQNIEREYHQPIDRYSQAVFLSNLELLLTYAQRYYNRQFITREQMGSDTLQRFDQELHRYFAQESLTHKGIPTVAYFAEHLHLSPNYLSDLLRSLTGKSTQEHIQFQVIRKAKEYLLGSDWTVAQVAYELGFEYPSYFSKLFKSKTGCSPRQFRQEQGLA